MFSTGTAFSLVSEATQERKQEREAQRQGASLYNYMNADQQQKAQLTVDHQGIYRNSQGLAVTGTFLYVVLEDYRIIHVPDCRNENDISYRHSCLANGKKVLAAGKITLTEGRLIMVSNESGHYKPTGEKMCPMLSVFIRDSQNPDLIFQDHTDAGTGYAYEYFARELLLGNRQAIKKFQQINPKS